MQVCGHARALAENQDRQWTAAGDLLRDAAYAPTPGTCAAVATYDNEVRLVRVCGGKDRQRGITCQYLSGNAYAREYVASSNHGEILLRSLDFRVDSPHRYTRSFQACDIRVDNLQ